MKMINMYCTYVFEYKLTARNKLQLIYIKKHMYNTCLSDETAL